MLGISLAGCIAAAAVTLYNLFTKPVYRSIGKTDDEPFISVLIPARNEEDNIGGCLEAVLNQEYANYDITVLNDESTDGTYALLESYAKRDDKITVLQGEPLAAGWLGKNYACHRLALQAKGDYYLFIDADVRIHSGTLRAAASYIALMKPALLTVFPSQLLESFGERFVVPLMNWLLISFLPLRQVYRSKRKSFVAANGQFMLIESEAYKALGGHEAVKAAVVEDIELARRAKSMQMKVITLAGGEFIKTRMYSSFSGSIEGFTKNFYPGFSTTKIVFSFMLLFFFVSYFLPIVLSFFDILFIISLLLIIVNRAGVALVSRQSVLWAILLHPVQMLIMMYIGIRSMVFSGKGKVTWKGRTL